MKKIFLIIISTSFFINANSQITTRNWLVGGSFNFKKSKSETEAAILSRSSNLTVTPNIGYFFIDKLAAGLKADIFIEKQKYPQISSDNSITQSKLGFGPFVRYYFLSTESKINVFADAGFLYSFYSSKNTGQPRNSYNSFNYSVFAGPAFFLNSSVAIELLVGYNRTKWEDETNSTAQDIQIKIGFQIHLEKE